MELGHLNTTSSLLSSRRASCQLASSSSTVPRAYQTYSYGDNSRQSQARAVSITWDASEQQWGSLEGLQGADSRRSRAESQEKPAELTTEEEAEGRPLKINRDLLLYRAKSLRQEAFRVQSFSERMRCYQQAEAAINRCLQLDPTDARAYVGLGRLLCLQRRFDEARRVYEDGVAVTGGQNAHVWQAWATMEARIGKTAPARKYFNAAVLVDPSHGASWHAWGMLEKKEGNFVAARDLWVKGVKKSAKKNLAHMYQSLAVLAGEMGFVDEARAWFRQGTATVRGAASHALWHAWAQLEERSGEPRVVRYLYKKGLEINTRSRYVHLAWAMFEKAESETENARKLLQRGQQLNPNDAAILQAWAVLEGEEGNVEEARKLFRLAADVDPQMVHVWQAWGMLELRQGNAQQARQLFQSAVWCNSSNADVCKVWQAWGCLERKCDNIGLARSMFKCAIKADPSSKQAWEAWINMERDLGEDNRAYAIARMRAAGRTDVPLPDSFQLPSDLATGDEPNALEAVVKTVSEWLQKFDSKRGVARRRPPSYLQPPTAEAEPYLLEQQGDALPPLATMMEADHSDLDLPELPKSLHPSTPPRSREVAGRKLQQG